MVDITGVDEFTARIITATGQFIGPFYFDYTGVSGSYNMVSSDVIIVCDTSSAACNVNLVTANGNQGQYVYIKDGSGNAGNNTITVIPNGADTIDGNSGLSIQGDWQSFGLVSNGSDGWLIF